MQIGRFTCPHYNRLPWTFNQKCNWCPGILCNSIQLLTKSDWKCYKQFSYWNNVEVCQWHGPHWFYRFFKYNSVRPSILHVLKALTPAITHTSWRATNPFNPHAMVRSTTPRNRCAGNKDSKLMQAWTKETENLLKCFVCTLQDLTKILVMTKGTLL